MIKPDDRRCTSSGYQRREDRFKTRHYVILHASSVTTFNGRSCVSHFCYFDTVFIDIIFSNYFVKNEIRFVCQSCCLQLSSVVFGCILTLLLRCSMECSHSILFPCNMCPVDLRVQIDLIWILAARQVLSSLIQNNEYCNYKQTKLNKTLRCFTGDFFSYPVFFAFTFLGWICLFENWIKFYILMITHYTIRRESIY